MKSLKLYLTLEDVKKAYNEELQVVSQIFTLFPSAEIYQNEDSFLNDTFTKLEISNVNFEDFAKVSNEIKIKSKNLINKGKVIQDENIPFVEIELHKTFPYKFHSSAKEIKISWSDNPKVITLREWPEEVERLKKIIPSSLLNKHQVRYQLWRKLRQDETCN